MTIKRDYYEQNKKILAIMAEQEYHLHVFGDELSARYKYKSVSGIEAVDYHLMQKYHWLPSQIRAMTAEDKRFALSEEMQGWTLPKAAVF